VWSPPECDCLLCYKENGEKGAKVLANAAAATDFPTLIGQTVTGEETDQEII
jgi:hypothetical protein